MQNSSLSDSQRRIYETEIALHESDFEYGQSLNLGELQIAFHAANCKRCAYLALRAIISSEAWKKHINKPVEQLIPLDGR